MRAARWPPQRVQTLGGERVDRPLTGLARLLARLQVAEPREALGLDVVLALSRPVEHTPASRHAHQIVCARATGSHESEDLVGEEGQLISCDSYET